MESAEELFYVQQTFESEKVYPYPALFVDHHLEDIIQDASWIILT